MSAKLRVCLTGLFLFLQIYLSAQDKSENYIKGAIPDSLTKGADAVCRLDEQEVEILSPGKIVVRERHVYTILNDNAEGLSTYNTHYDKLTTINYANGTLYNSLGKELKHFKKKDMSDYSNPGIALVSDERMKTNSFSYNSYPYTVDYEEEDEEAGTFYLPDWEPPRSSKISVEVSRYILTAPVNYKFRYKLFNTDVKPTITTRKDKITYVWEIRNLPVVPKEPFSVSNYSYNPFMLVGPTDFEMEGYNGNMSDWNEYAKFYSLLQKGRDVLPEDLKQQVHKLTDNIADPYKKIEILYDYLQKNTHYVLIMFGIGGWQPYDASYVAKNKYGDCKALSNFMVALLKEAGIKGHAVIIRGDEQETDFFAEFPTHQFNHVICAVPVGKDTVWLECTDQYLPAGYLGSFTANRYGLFIDENGGSLVHTPAYLLKDNTSIRKISANLDGEGNLQLKSETDYRALSHEQVWKYMHYYSREQQMDQLKKDFYLPTYTVNSFQYKEDHSARLPVIHESLDISVTNYAHISGKRIFIKPDILRLSKTKLPEDKERKLDFQFKSDFREVDSVEILVPGGYAVESQPKDNSLETRYGKYQTHLVVGTGKIFYYRLFEQFRGRFPASDYDEIKSFYNRVYEADHSQIVLFKTN
jgi:Domain of Unknown Function with PDB structure (DUF3857)/Transglutaminase-like superfamily